MNSSKRLRRSTNAGDIETPRRDIPAACSDRPWYYCPISWEPMRRPVSASDGVVYDQDSLEKLISCSGQYLKSPTTNLPMTSTFTTAISFRWAMQEHSQAREHLLPPDFNADSVRRARELQILQTSPRMVSRLQANHQPSHRQMLGREIIPGLVEPSAFARYQLSEWMSESFSKCIHGAILGSIVGVIWAVALSMMNR